MAQDPKQTGPAPIGVVYNSSMSRPDAALALAALYVSATRRAARVNAVAVTGTGFDAAVFCDIVARFYTMQTRTSSNAVLPIGFAADPALPNPPMVERAVTRMHDGQPQYSRGIRAVADTAAPDALLRNAITMSTEIVVVLSAPATWLARSLALAGTPAQYRQRVKRVVIVDAGDLEKDRDALGALTAALPAPPIVCGRAVGDALGVARERLLTALSWATPHPIADVLQASGQDAVPLHDLAALYYALHPESEWFSAVDGRLSVGASTLNECAGALVSLATSRPAPPPARSGGS